MENNRIYRSIYTAQYSNRLGEVSVLTPSIRLSSFRCKPDLSGLFALRSSNACVVDESNKQQSDFRDDTKISFKTKYTN